MSYASTSTTSEMGKHKSRTLSAAAGVSKRIRDSFVGVTVPSVVTSKLNGTWLSKKLVKMVQLEKLQGQKGAMIIQEDGTIVSSSGDLASSEGTSQIISSLMSQSLLVDSNIQSTNRGQVNACAQDDNGATIANGAAGDNGDTSAHSAGQPWKWNRMTVSFGDHSYMACLSNRKIHVVKRMDPEHTGTSSIVD